MIGYRLCWRGKHETGWYESRHLCSSEYEVQEYRTILDDGEDEDAEFRISVWLGGKVIGYMYQEGTA